MRLHRPLYVGAETAIDVGFAAVGSVEQIAVPWTAEQDARGAPAPSLAGLAMGQWAAHAEDEPWSAYTQPAAAGMTATPSGESLQ